MKDVKSKTEQKGQFEEMLLDIMSISELFNELQQLQTQIIDLMENEVPDDIEKIQALKNEYSVVNEKLTSKMNVFEKRYPIADKE